MKKSIRILVITFIMSLSFNTINAQNYSFTLVDDGNYDFTIAAVTEFDSGTFAPVTQSYGFTLVVPDGVTITFNTYLPAGTSGTATPIAGTSVSALDASMADKDLYFISTDTSAGTFAAHMTGETINLVSFTVNGMPTTGELTVLDNNSTLASAPALGGSLDSFIQIDIIDDATVIFNNEFTGLTGTTSINFSTLGLDDNVLESTEVSIYPNPTSDVINIKSTIIIDSVEMFDLLGKQVLTIQGTEQIKVNHLPTGVYILKVYSDKGKFSKKVIIE